MKREKINHPKHYNIGSPEVIKISDSWGLAGDADAFNVLKYFLRAPYKGNEEEDYRKAMWYLERIYSRRGECELKAFNNQTFTNVVIRTKKLNLHWFKPTSIYKASEDREIGLIEVIKGWKLNGLRAFFIENFYYKQFHCEACMNTLGKLIDEIAEVNNEEDGHL